MKYVEKASDETLEKNYKNYVTKQLDEVNEQITNTLIKQLSNLMTSLDLIDDGEDLERDLEHNELLKRNVKNVLSLLCSASRCPRSLALHSFTSLEMAASFFPCSTLLGSLTLSFSTKVILVSLFSPSIYLRVTLKFL